MDLKKDKPQTVVSLRELLKRVPVAGSDYTILDGVTASAKPGELVMLSGVSGSGKSTLLNILGTVDEATSGTVEVNGHLLNSLDIKQKTVFRAQSIGFIFQFFNLLPTLTVIENVASALEPLGVRRKERLEKAENALKSVEMANHLHKFPQQLSGGEQQRVGIARAIVKKPPLLLADEPTGALDESTALTILKLINDIRKQTGMTVIVASHDPLVREFADTEWHLANHKLVVKS